MLALSSAVCFRDTAGEKEELLTPHCLHLHSILVLTRVTQLSKLTPKKQQQKTNQKKLILLNTERLCVWLCSLYLKFFQ